MKNKKTVLAGLLICAGTLSMYLFQIGSPPVVSKTITIQDATQVAVASPVWGVSASAVVFADSRRFELADLAQQLASLGVSSAVVDSIAFFKTFNTQNNKCLDEKQLAQFIASLGKEIPPIKENRLFITGIGEGALIPFLNAQSEHEENTENLSIGFTVKVPADLSLCSPFTTVVKEQNRNLATAAAIKSKWRSVWNEKPSQDTEIFIKEKVPQADTDITAYNTPLDRMLVNELKVMIGQGNDSPPMPIIEIPAEKGHETVTLFYSGDGGWRDLDKSVAEEMAKLDYSVLGVDVLRYFWERKTPDQVTSDLIATMRFYRTNWGVKSFVLAGFSFGADILPVIYNKLPESEKSNVDLLVFLALGNHADFEVHVAGWLGQSTREMPLASELLQIPKNKVLCIYGKEEKAKTGTACSSLENSEAKVIELPGGHHFDKDYPKLARLILDNYRQHGIH